MVQYDTNSNKRIFLYCRALTDLLVWYGTILSYNIIFERGTPISTCGRILNSSRRPCLSYYTVCVVCCNPFIAHLFITPSPPPDKLFHGTTPPHSNMVLTSYITTHHTDHQEVSSHFHYHIFYTLKCYNTDHFPFI
jgi:hypothetical protein